MADAVSQVTGAPITYVIRVNFPNFVQMVDEMGGIDIDIPAPMSDSFSGAQFDAGADAPHRRPGARVLARPALVQQRRPHPHEQPGAR